MNIFITDIFGYLIVFAGLIISIKILAKVIIRTFYDEKNKHNNKEKD